MLPPTPPVSTDLCTTSVNLLSAPLQACLSLPRQASLSNRKRSTLELQQQQGSPKCTLQILPTAPFLRRLLLKYSLLLFAPLCRTSCFCLLEYISGCFHLISGLTTILSPLASLLPSPLRHSSAAACRHSLVNSSYRVVTVGISALFFFSSRFSDRYWQTEQRYELPLSGF